MNIAERIAHWIDRHEGVKVWLQSKLSAYPPEWLNNPGRLDDWAYAHSISSGNVWAVTPSYGDAWPLWAPGGLAVGEPFPLAEPAATYPDDPASELWRLADIEVWLRPWIESVTQGRVVEMVEGLRWFGDGIDYESVIYARVET